MKLYALLFSFIQHLGRQDGQRQKPPALDLTTPSALKGFPFTDFFQRSSSHSPTIENKSTLGLALEHGVRRMKSISSTSLSEYLKDTKNTSNKHQKRRHSVRGPSPSSSRTTVRANTLSQTSISFGSALGFAESRKLSVFSNNLSPSSPNNLYHDREGAFVFGSRDDFSHSTSPTGRFKEMGVMTPCSGSQTPQLLINDDEQFGCYGGGETWNLSLNSDDD